jgi:plastocyanin
MNKRTLITRLAGAAALCLIAVSANAQDGSITGTVKYDGTAPKPKQVDITKDKEVCGLKPHFEEDLMVGSDGGIANAIIYIADAKAAPKPETVNFDQKGCDYVPHVLAFPAGSTIKIINDDGILHNIHTYSTKNPTVNIAQPKFKKVVDVTVADPELIKVTCDAHGWMHGWWFSSANPYYAVTDDKGSFTIKDVPAGDYEVTIWQEKLGEQKQKVTVKAGAPTTLDVSMKPKA